jgi:serine/threonine-protein phosphatase 4 catalytic subunit
LKVLEVVDDVLLRNEGSRGKIAFLGDYIDRGLYGMECIILILSYKLAFPNRVFLLRGNHDS